MKSYFYYLLMVISTGVLLMSCSDDDAPMLNLNISGLEDLGSSALYEGWIIVDGNAITTGTFSVDGNGVMSANTFEVDENDLANASTFVLTIEPSPDNDPAPSDVHILAGDFSTNSANLTISHGAALNNDFASVHGTYVLATPTDGMNNNENSGIWFLDISSGSPAPGLDIPTLPNGWIYEGWVVIDGTPVSTGTFSSASGVDGDDSFSGTMGGPPYPGEDFVQNAPAGLSFPTDLAGGIAVISIEPVPDNSPAPFLLKPLVGDIPADATDHTGYDIGANLNFPSGSATR